MFGSGATVDKSLTKILCNVEAEEELLSYLAALRAAYRKIDGKWRTVGR